jgi:ABC-type dipeptide/oligopeptide/nickel transport system ATPase subunit
MTVASIVAEPLEEHGIVKGRAKRERVEQLLESVGLNPRFSNRYPHEFSGGQKQRIGVARALALDSDFIVCDEPIAVLDVSIQAQVVNLLEDLRERLGLTYPFISHDLSMIRHIADRVAVMYLSGQNRRAGIVQFALQRTAASVYAGAAVGGADFQSGTGREAPAHRAQRRRPESGQTSARLSFQQSLPARSGTVLSAGAGIA